MEMVGRAEDVIILSSEDEGITKREKEADELRRQQQAKRKRKFSDRDDKRQLSLFESFHKQIYNEPPLHNVKEKMNSLNKARGPVITMSTSPKSSARCSEGVHHSNVSN